MINALFFCLLKGETCYLWCGSSQKSRTLPKKQSQPDTQEPSRGLRERRKFNFQEVANATHNFSLEHCVDVTGFGKVYRGKLEGSKKIIAVERLDTYGSRGHGEFLTALLTLSFLKHPNLINLLGYCCEKDERILVHEYLPLGSLDEHLHDRVHKPLDWQTRMKIALGIARGLEYMHHNTGPAVIHRNLTPANILLDDDFNPKISDFGLCIDSREDDEPHTYASVTGTSGYIAPEYMNTGLLSVMADVYSFGVILLELITGRRAFDVTRKPKEQNLVSWANRIMKYPEKFPELADPLLHCNYPGKAFRQAVRVAAMCLQEKDTHRPMMTDVVNALTHLSSDHNSGPSRPYLV